MIFIPFRSFDPPTPVHQHSLLWQRLNSCKCSLSFFKLVLIALPSRVTAASLQPTPKPTPKLPSKEARSPERSLEGRTWRRPPRRCPAPQVRPELWPCMTPLTAAGGTFYDSPLLNNSYLEFCYLPLQHLLEWKSSWNAMLSLLVFLMNSQWIHVALRTLHSSFLNCTSVLNARIHFWVYIILVVTKEKFWSRFARHGASNLTGVNFLDDVTSEVTWLIAKTKNSSVLFCFFQFTFHEAGIFCFYSIGTIQFNVNKIFGGNSLSVFSSRPEKLGNILMAFVNPCLDSQTKYQSIRSCCNYLQRKGFPWGLYGKNVEHKPTVTYMLFMWQNLRAVWRTCLFPSPLGLWLW